MSIDAREGNITRSFSSGDAVHIGGCALAAEAYDGSRAAHFAAVLESAMNTTVLRPHAALSGSSSPTRASATRALHAAARDFIMGLLSITKSGLLLQQSVKPRVRRF
jgi:hypothetical protein